MDTGKCSRCRLLSLIAGKGGWSQFQDQFTCIPALFTCSETLCGLLVDQEQEYLLNPEHVESMDSHNCWSNSLRENHHPYQLWSWCNRSPAKQVSSDTDYPRRAGGALSCMPGSARTICTWDYVPPVEGLPMIDLLTWAQQMRFIGNSRSLYVIKAVYRQ